MSRVAIIGLGNIGAGCAKALVRNGHEVHGYDVNADTCKGLSQLIVTAESPAEAASRAEVVLICVYDGPQVEKVVSGDQGILTADPRPKTIAILTTCDINTILWAEKQGKAAGVGVLDCGVTGGAAALTTGGMVALVGGTDETLEEARAVIESFASLVLRMGPIGSGMKAKLARNAIVFGQWYVVAEAVKLAQISGVDVSKLIQACEAGDRTLGPYFLVGKRGIAPVLSEHAATLEEISRRKRFANFAHKDVGAFLAYASELGLEAPVATLVARDFEKAVGLEPGA